MSGYIWETIKYAMCFKSTADGTSLLEADLPDEVIMAILNKGADVHVRDTRKEMTPLMLALKRKRSVAIVQKLLDCGSDLNAICKRGKTPLIYGIQSNYSVNIIKEIIRKGADINHKCKLGRTPLSYAIKGNKSSEIITYLISAGSDTNVECSYGKSPLIYAIENNCDKMVILELIKKCNDINRVSPMHPNNLPPLFYAIDGNIPDPDVFKALISAGASFHHRVEELDFNILMAITCKNCDGYINCNFKQVIDILLKSGVDVNETICYGSNIIHFTQCKYLMESAVKQGVNIEARNDNGYTPLMVAVLHNMVEKVKALLILNANPNCADFDSSNLLHYSETINDEIVELLLYHGADLLAKESHGYMPLDLLSFQNELKQSSFEILAKNFLLFYNENGLKDCFIFDKNSSRKSMSEFIDSCKNELEKLRCVLVTENLSFYDFCILKKSYRSKFVCISFHDYHYNFDQIKNMFPLYKNLIIKRIKDNHKHQFYRVLCNCLQKIVIRPFLVHDDKSLTVELRSDLWYHISRYFNHKNIYYLFLASLKN